MAGDLTSPFQGLQPTLPPRVATTLSREQFLYSLARTPSPARFQRPRSNCQVSTTLNANVPPGIETDPSSEQFLYSLSRTPSAARFQQPLSNRQIHRGPNNPFQKGEIEGSVARYPHDDAGAYGCDPVVGPYSGSYSKPPGKHPVVQMDQCSEEANRRQDFLRNEAVTNIQKLALAPEAEPRSTLRAAQIPTPTSERSAFESGKRAVGIIASDIYSITPSPPSAVTPVAAVEFGECNPPSNLSDESGYDSNDSSGEGSGSFYTDVNMTLSGVDDSNRATAQSTEVRSYLDSNIRIRKSPQIEQDKPSVIYQRFKAADANRILPGRSKKKLKRPDQFYSKMLAQDVALQAIQGERAEKIHPGEICRTFDQLKLIEERAVQKSNSEAGEVLSDNNSSMIESQLITADVPFDDDSSMIEGQPAAPGTPLLSVFQKRFPESSPQKPRKNSKKTYPNTKMVSSKIHFKDLTLINRGPIPADDPKPIPTRLDFCDGFVGEESQPIGRTKATSRPRRRPRSGMLRLAMGYTCQLPLVQSRAFVIEPSLQEENRRNAPTPITRQTHQTGKFITMDDGRMVPQQEHEIPMKEMSNLNAALDGGLSGAPSNGSNVHYSQRVCGIKESGRSTVGDESEKRNADLKERVSIQFGPELLDDSGHSKKEQRGSTSDTQQGGPIPSQPTVGKSKARQVSDGDQESIADYRTSSFIEDVDMDMGPNPQSEESDNDSSFSGSSLLDMSPKISTFNRRVTFNEDVEVIRQQLAMVSAPLPVSTASSEYGSDSGHMGENDEDDEDAHSYGSDSHTSESGGDDDEDTSSDGSRVHASEDGSEVGSNADEHYIESASPHHNHRSLYTTLPSTPIRRWASTGALGSSGGGGFETEMLDDDMILDGTSSIVSEVSGAVHLWEKSYDDKKSNVSPSCPWAPRRPAQPRHGTEDDEDTCASPSSRIPRTKTVNNIRFNQSRMDWSSTQPATRMPHIKTHRRAPSVELGNPEWPPRSFLSQSVTESQTSRVVDLSYQSKKFMVTDVPSYFSAASQNFHQPLYRPTVPPLRSKSTPLRLQYFEKERQDWSTDENISSHSMYAGEVASFLGGQDEGNTGLRALTRHISIGFGTPDKRRRNPSLSFRPPLKHI